MCRLSVRRRGDGVIMEERMWKWWRSGCSRFWRFLLDLGGAARAKGDEVVRVERQSMLDISERILEVCASM